MFDRWSDFGDKRRRLMEQSWAGVFRNHLLVELPVDDLCRHLDERMGRPSKDLHVVIGVLLLQQLHDLSDAETVEALAFNMAWHYALDVRSEADSYFCEKTLRNYRRLFIEQGLDELLFRCLTDRLVQGFSVDTSHQRMDSTALRSAMRALTRLGIVVESISKFARELERYHPGLHEQISKEVIRRYVDREGNGAFANTAPSVSKRRLGEAGQDLLALVLQFRDTAAAKLSSFAILERVLRDQFEIVDDECGDRDAKRATIRDPKDVPCDTVGKPGRPPVSSEFRGLIRRMSRENPLWGAPRIHGELRMLGFEVSEAAVSKYMPRHPKPPSQTWRTFLENHVGCLASTDFFVVPTATFSLLFVLVVLRHERRRIVHIGTTAHPTAAWVAQQIREAFPWETAPRYMIRDRDRVYGIAFRSRIKAMGIEEVVTAPRSPWQSPYVERVIGSIRRECLDHVIVLNERHLRAILLSYIDYYQRSRTHLALGKDTPERRSVQPAGAGKIVAFPQVGGLHHRYQRLAA